MKNDPISIVATPLTLKYNAAFNFAWRLSSPYQSQSIATHKRPFSQLRETAVSLGEHHMTEKTDALIPVAQKQVLFYEDEITAVQVDGGEVLVPIRPLCDLLGLNWSGQQQRIQRDTVLSQVSCVCVIHTQTQRRDMLCLPLQYINGWLFGINAKRVTETVRDRLIKYQLECYQVLHEAFQDGRLTADPDLEALLQEDSPEAQAYKIIQGMLRLAHNQLLMKARLQDHEQRLEAIESQLGDPARYVTPAQATSISQAVKAIALVLSKQTRRNEYGAVFGELYRRYNVPSYRELPAHKYQECLDWLNEWKAQLESNTFWFLNKRPFFPSLKQSKTKK